HPSERSRSARCQALRYRPRDWQTACWQTRHHDRTPSFPHWPKARFAPTATIVQKPLKQTRTGPASLGFHPRHPFCADGFYPHLDPPRTVSANSQSLYPQSPQAPAPAVFSTRRQNCSSTKPTARCAWPPGPANTDPTAHGHQDCPPHFPEAGNRRWQN
ncbi:MAG: hypothetical protein RIR95_1383, partial [Pseudomonadota bacterium]